MTSLRRFLVVLALMGWLGGFMFYGGVTVPVVRATLEGMPERSLITQRVTAWMNLLGTLALIPLFADVYASPLPRRRGRWVAWLLMAVPMPALVWLHRVMSRQMAAPGFHDADPTAFLNWHRAYLLLNTLQWAGGMAFTWLALRAWRAEDQAR